MTFQPLDVVVPIRNLPTHSLVAGDLGAIVEVCTPESIGIEFVAASGRTKGLVTLQTADLRKAGDDDLVAVGPSGSSTGR